MTVSYKDIQGYRNWLLNKRDKAGKPVSAMYSTVLGFDEVIFVKDKVNLSDA